ncbi:unnamed protein product [Oppiella nova]|uniref:Uncharacterized protein n=1 Tax=Oppiella nova TaxID=334625 RepID=A0A7R9MAI8_9ACAR|nr:unnamed protein product [Oppiella nova]CAG2173745.1 unnamed protein product [Oppiella nova]
MAVYMPVLSFNSIQSGTGMWPSKN